MVRIVAAKKGIFVHEPLRDQAFLRGEEVRSDGSWFIPEEWGTWVCYDGGELAMMLPDTDSSYCFVPLRLHANRDPVWEGSLGHESQNLSLRVRRQPAGGAWRLRLRAQIDLTPELRNQIAALDAGVPTIAFERLVVVPENDLKTRLDIRHTFATVTDHGLHALHRAERLAPAPHLGGTPHLDRGLLGPAATAALRAPRLPVLRGRMAGSQMCT